MKIGLVRRGYSRTGGAEAYLRRFAETAAGSGHEIVLFTEQWPVGEWPFKHVPIESRSLKGLDSLLSIVQMPAGVPVATLAIGIAGAKNAALLAVAILANKRRPLREKLKAWREGLKRKVLEESLS